MVMGNQACDLDSIVSAVTLSYLRSLQEGSSTVWYPLVPIPAREVKLRTEVTYLFSQLNLDISKLSSLESFSFEKFQGQQDSLRVTLVDHNSLSSNFSAFSSCVEEIVDHHEDLKASFPTLKTKQIEIVGSTATLVAEKFFDDIKGREAISKDVTLRQLLLGTILLDTVGLDPHFGKTFPKDQLMVKNLHELDPSVDINKFFEAIQEAKFDISSLNTSDLLIKDYKDWTAESDAVYGVATVLLSLKTWLSMGEDLCQHFEDFCSERDLSILFCMLAYQADDSVFRRELIVFKPKSPPVILDFAKLLLELQEGAGKESLQLSPITMDLAEKLASSDVWFFSQENIKASRKALQPLVHKLLAKL